MEKTAIIMEKKEEEKEKTSKEKYKELYANARKLGNKVITGTVQGITKQPQYKQAVVKKNQRFIPSKTPQALQFIAQPNSPQNQIDDFEELRKAVNIPKKPEPTLILNKAGNYFNDLDPRTSDLLPNKKDITHGESIVDEDFYGGLDIL